MSIKTFKGSALLRNAAQVLELTEEKECQNYVMSAVFPLDFFLLFLSSLFLFCVLFFFQMCKILLTLIIT